MRGPAGPAEVEVFGSRRASEALQELCHEMIGINLSCSAHNASTCPEIPRTVDILLPIYSRVTIIITGKKVRPFASAVDVNLGKFRVKSVQNLALFRKFIFRITKSHFLILK